MVKKSRKITTDDALLRDIREDGLDNYEEWRDRERRYRASGRSADVQNYCKARAYASRDGFYQYCVDILGYKDLYQPFHRPMCEQATNPKTRYKMLQACRGSFKSSIRTIGYTTWRLGREFVLTGECNQQILIASEVLNLANAFVSAIGTVMEHNTAYKELFGDHRGPKRTKIWQTNNFTSRYRTILTAHSPTVSSLALDAPRAGFHYDLIIADDLETERSSATREQIDKVWSFYQLLHSLLGADIDPKGEMQLVSTRWHHNDIYQRILEQNEDEQIEDERYDVMIKPAEDENGRLAFPTKFTRKHLDHLKRRHGSYHYSCTPGYAMVTMSDFTDKKIREIEVGDEVVGFEEYKKGAKRHLCKAVVQFVSEREAEVFRYHLSNGDHVDCTVDHKWFMGRRATKKEPGRKTYMPLVVGRTIRQVYKKLPLSISGRELGDWRYLAAMVDGEGACKSPPGGNITIHQCPHKNPEVHAEIRRNLDSLNLTYLNNSRYVIVHGGSDFKRKLLAFGKPAKARQITSGMFKACFCRSKATVVSVESLGVMPVYGIQTTTGNYISQGYASANCQFLLDPTPEEDRIFKAAWLKESNPRDYTRRGTRCFLGADMAYTEQYRLDSGEIPRADWTVILAVLVDHDWNFVIKDVFRERCSKREAIKQMYEMFIRNECIQLGLQKFDRAQVEESLIQYGYEIGKMINYEFVTYPARQSKNDRIITALQPLVEGGKLKLLPGVDWLKEEFLDFPRAATDDGLDALCNIIKISRPAPGYKAKKKETWAEQHIRELQNGTFDPDGTQWDWRNF